MAASMVEINTNQNSPETVSRFGASEAVIAP
jgi:hypothetical protein